MVIHTDIVHRGIVVTPQHTICFHDRYRYTKFTVYSYMKTWPRRGGHAAAAYDRTYLVTRLISHVLYVKVYTYLDCV